MSGDRPGRLVLLVTTPRVAPGLLSRTAWTTLGQAQTVLARDLTEPQAQALLAAGVQVDEPRGPQTALELATDLLGRAAGALVVWVGSADGDPGLTDALATAAARDTELPELEVLVASWDSPGGRLLDAVAVMDRLRSPGGCPWDAEQTHASLVPYLIEEAHEAVEALEREDAAHICEELGDVLLQVLFHARVAAESDDGFDIDDVAAGLVAKLVRRHPHVFGDVDAADAAAVQANWDTIKAAEKPERDHPLEGIPDGMPELARAAKVASRLDRAGLGPWLDGQVQAWRATEPDPAGHRAHGLDLLGAVLRARDAGVDPAAALRAVLRDVHDSLPDRDGRPAGGIPVQDGERSV